MSVQEGDGWEGRAEERKKERERVGRCQLINHVALDESDSDRQNRFLHKALFSFGVWLMENGGIAYTIRPCSYCTGFKRRLGIYFVICLF